jgi:hypothetical protein
MSKDIEIKLFKDLTGKRIIRIHKKLLDIYNEKYISQELYEFKSDGILVLEFSDFKILNFQANTERHDIDISELQVFNPDVSMGFIDLSMNIFFENIINQKIASLKYLIENNKSIGISFYFENDIILNIHYVSENEYSFDLLTMTIG